MSEDPAITGILPLMPLPRHISKLDLIQQLDPEKDMDCVHPMNSGRLYLGITPGDPVRPGLVWPSWTTTTFPWKAAT